MSLTIDAAEMVRSIGPYLIELGDAKIDRLIESGAILNDLHFSPRVEHPFGQFYAPFDWINDSADIVLVGITPGRRQAKTATKALRRALAKGDSPETAAQSAKQAASFEGDMRLIATQLMDRFRLHQLFGLSTSSELFDIAKHRAHYTSILRHPVLHWKGKLPEAAWTDYSGGKQILKSELMRESIKRDFEREIIRFPDAWLVPFGPVPAMVLGDLTARGLVDGRRVLSGMNHPAGTQWNRHNCQLNRTNDHAMCAKNVGCVGLQEKSARLQAHVEELLA